MKSAVAFALAFASLTAPYALHAQDPATDHSGSDDGRPDEGTSWKYFYFHKADINEEQARSDMIECYGYARRLVVSKSGGSQTYSSVPYSAVGNLSPLAAGLAGGVGALLGGVMVSFMDAGSRRAMERSNLRKCFAFKGYDRYELSKNEHEALFEGEPEEVRNRQVARSVGDTPETERLVR